MAIIKFGISENYIPDWKINQAIREIYQNFIDYGDFDVHIDKISDTTSYVTLSNNFNPVDLEFLKIGFSKKSEVAIGKHGEGLKLAGLIFIRNNYKLVVRTNKYEITPAFYNDDNIGDCYGMECVDYDGKKFEVSFEADNSSLDSFNEGRINDSEDILSVSHYGNIVKKNKGNIYVGGLFVCLFKGLNHAFDFNPVYVTLGRDRDFPKVFDIEYYANKIINSCEKELTFNASDITNREFNIGEIPTKLARKFNPVITDSGNIHMQSNNTIVTDEIMILKFLKIPLIAKRLERLKSFTNSKSRKSPHTILKELKSELCLNDLEEIKFNSILKMSINWKAK